MSAGNPVEIDLYVWSLDGDESERLRLARLLSHDETARAERLVFERDRHRFIVARGRLREILARVTKREPEALRFSYAAHGKPSLEGCAEKFNLTHSQSTAALGITRAHEIGVDVECVRPLKEDIAGRFFSPAEVAALRALPADLQTEAFFRCWTRKEAVVKAIGDGLSHPLDSFDVSLASDEVAAVQRIDGDSPDRWRLATFKPASGYTGAIACRTGGREIKITVKSLPQLPWPD